MFNSTKKVRSLHRSRGECPDGSFSTQPSGVQSITTVCLSQQYNLKLSKEQSSSVAGQVIIRAAD